MIESLESRVLMTRYSLLTVLNYTDAGSSYKYATDMTIGPNSLIGASHELTTSKKTVAKTSKAPISDVVRTVATSGHSSETMAFTPTASGVRLSSESLTDNTLSASLIFSKVQFAPTALTLNKKYTGSGSMTGSLRVGGFSGSLSGSVKTSVTLFGTTTITVRGVQYRNVMKGSFAIGVSGTMKVSANGHSASGPFSIQQTEAFWSLPSVGVVYDTRSATISGSADGTSAKIPVSAKDSLISYVLGKDA